MTMTRRYLLTLIVLLACTVSLLAQDGKRKFSPEKFEAELEEYITRKVAFTQQEAAKYFPLLREMHQKQRTLYGRIKHLAKQEFEDDAAAETALTECDKLNIELKEIEQKYHQRMVREVSPIKVSKAVKAESHFHRRMMKGMQKPKDRHR